MATYEAPSLATLAELPLANPADALRASAGAGNECVSHESLRSCVRSVAANLIATNAERNSVVGILLPNGPEFIVAFLATTHAGCATAPLNPKYTASELEFYISDASIASVLVLPDTPNDAPIFEAARKTGAAVLRLPADLSDVASYKTKYGTPGQADDLAVLRERAPTESDVALYLHTSGTTSKPKLVPLTHKNLCTSIGNIAATYRLTAEDCNVLVMPLFHVHGLMSATLSTLATGGCIAIPPGGKFSASAFWPAVVASKASWYTAVPTIHQILLSRASEDYPSSDPPKLRFIRSCSASLAPAVLQKLEHTFGAPVLEAYAMTEAAHQMTSNPLPDKGKAKPGTVGLPQNVQVAILDELNVVLGSEQVGEVCIRGDNVTAGYHNNPEANDAAFAGGWFHTGDQGILDADGYLRLTGRIKELVNRGGEKISPLEVDAALLAHPSVTEAVSFAVPDEKYGEEVNAAVILKPDAVGTVTPSELADFAGARLAAFKVPKRFFISDDLPRTATGKIQRRIVSKHFLDQLG